MSVIALKYCTECGVKRRFFQRLFAWDDELCDDCYIELMNSVHERRDESREKGSR